MANPEQSTTELSVQFKGSCACGRITYECFEAPLEGATNTCLCVTCRKLSGGPYQAFTDVNDQALVFFDQHAGSRYEGLPKDNIEGIFYVRLLKSGAAERAFCASCYTPLAMRYMHQPDVINVVLGSVDEESIETPEIREALKLKFHIFTSQRPFWCDIDSDGLPQHKRFMRNFEGDMKAWESKTRNAE